MGGETEARVQSPQDKLPESEKYLRLRVKTAHLQKPKWNEESDKVLATAIHTLDRNSGLLEGAVAKS